MTEPSGAVTEYQYGDAGTPAFPALRQGRQPRFFESLDHRRLVAITVRPEGSSGPAHTTTIEHERSDPLDPDSPHCRNVQWVKETRPDGSILRKGLCDGRAYLHGQVLALEQWEGSVLKEGHYYGNIGRPGGSGLLGSMYLAGESADASGVSDLAGTLDLRPLKIVHFRDGVTWIERAVPPTSWTWARPAATSPPRWRRS